MMYRHLWILPDLHKLVMIYDPSFYDVELAHNGPKLLYPPRTFQRQLDILCEHPEICEGHINIARSSLLPQVLIFERRCWILRAVFSCHYETSSKAPGYPG